MRRAVGVLVVAVAATAVPASAAASGAVIPPASPSMVLAAGDRCGQARADYSEELASATSARREAVRSARAAFADDTTAASTQLVQQLRAADSRAERKSARKTFTIAIRAARAERKQATKAARSAELAVEQQARSSFRTAVRECGAR